MCREYFEAKVSVPEEGIMIRLSFHDDWQEFFLLGGDYQVPAVKLNDGRVMVDLKGEIGHGVPKNQLEQLGCAVDRVITSAMTPSDHEVHIGNSRGDNYYFC